MNLPLAMRRSAGSPSMALDAAWLMEISTYA
jgi:hypothetical protein